MNWKYQKLNATMAKIKLSVLQCISVFEFQSTNIKSWMVQTLQF